MILRRNFRPATGAFTLIELLAVIAIIGVLAAILIPTVSGARTAALKAKTKIQFSQWAGAIESFRQEYGYYPVLTVNDKIDSALFYETLSGRKLADNTPVATGGNTKGIAFHPFNDGDFNSGRTALADAFGNTDLALVVDRNGDGQITIADTQTGGFPGVGAVGGSARFTPATGAADIPNSGLRATVIFYSAGKGNSQGDLILSWP